MKLRSILYACAVAILALSCIPKEEVKQEIIVPAESQAVFTDGLSFDAGESSQAQTKIVSFTATDKWTATIEETTKAPSWLSILPTGGNAGNVNMTVTVQPNTETTGRSARITIMCGPFHISFTVLQAGFIPKVVPVSYISLDKSSLSLEKGGTETLVATVKPDNATDKTVTWRSSDAAIASVDQNGKVTAVDAGTATITAKAGEKEATCVVTVTLPIVPVESITLDKTSVTLEQGETMALTATVKPDNATDKTVTWSSSDVAVAKVDQSGIVTAVSEGTATITAKAGEKEATCAVTVIISTIPVESIALDRTSVALEEGQTTTLTATIAPDDATDKTVVWNSSNTDIVTVDNGLITAVSEGTATITATAGDKSASCTVTVMKQVIAVTSVTLNKTTLSLIKGSSEMLVATVKPDDATDKTVTWSSSNTSVASVDETGKVTAVRSGSSIITAKAGEKEATCTVTVTVPVTTITLDKTSLILEIGQTETLAATVGPEDATDNTINWSSSNTSVATVANGVVTAVAEGNATITASIGDVTASCTVTVIQYVFGITPADITISGDGDTFTVTVVCTVQYSVTSMPSWISQQSVDDKVHTFKAERNPGNAERSDKIVFTDSKGTVLSCVVKQGKHSPDNTDGENEHVGTGDDINW